jgi:hypothetical protein
LANVDVEMNASNKYVYALDSFRGIVRQILFDMKVQIKGQQYLVDVYFEQ